MERPKASKAQIIQVVLTAVILAIVIAVGIMAVSTIGSVNKSMTRIEQELDRLDMDKVERIITNLDGTATTLKNVSDAIGAIFK